MRLQAGRSSLKRKWDTLEADALDLDPDEPSPEPAAVQALVSDAPSPEPAAAQALVPVPALPPAPAASVRLSLGECPVDGALAWPSESSSGSYFLFTQVEEDGPPRPGRKTPEEVGREGLWLAVKAAYAAVFPEGHACHAGPLFGKVAQEGHPRSTEDRLKRLHNHGAFAFAADHRWRAVERHLRETLGVKVLGPAGLFLLVCP